MKLLALPVAMLAFGLSVERGIETEWHQLFAGGVWAASLSATALALRFRQSNVALLALGTLAIHLLLEPIGISPTTNPATLAQGAAWIWPLIVLALVLLPERGLLNRPGLGRIVLVLFPVLSVAALAASGRPTPLWLGFGLVPRGLVEFFALPGVAIALTLAAMVAIGAVHRQRHTPLESAQLAILLAGMAAIAVADQRAVRSFWLIIGNLALIVALVQNSYRVAFHDELTGLPGRRALKALLATLGDRYVIAMLDVDHFKKFNDTYGHDVGDQVLCRVAKTIDRVTGGGQAFRYGGEEFTIVFPGKAITDALPHLDQVRQAMCATPFMVRKSDAKDGDAPQPVTISISIGAAERTNLFPDWEAVMKAADEALYRAKQQGRNRVCV